MMHNEFQANTQSLTQVCQADGFTEALRLLHVLLKSRNTAVQAHQPADQSGYFSEVQKRGLPGLALGDVLPARKRITRHKYGGDNKNNRYDNGEKAERQYQPVKQGSKQIRKVQ